MMDLTDLDSSLTVEQIGIKWKIKDFFGQLNKNGDSLKSPTIFVSSAERYLKICVKEDRRDNGSVYLCLEKKCSVSGHEVYYTLGILKCDGSLLGNQTSHRHYKLEVVNFGKFYQRSELKDAVDTDGALTIVCSICVNNNKVAETAVLTSLPNGIDTLSRNFKDLFLNQTEGDVTFKVNDTKFVAHQLILGTRSKVFQAMFKTDMLEKNRGVVEIEDSEPACFKDFLTFLYSGELDIISSNNGVGLYLLAEKYNLQELKVACSACMAREISTDSVCDVVHLASLHEDKELLEIATQYFVKHANTVLTTPKWFSFFTEHPATANELLVKMAETYIK